MSSNFYKKLIIFLGVSIGMQAGNGILTVSSRSFAAGGAIPAKYSYKGGNLSPHLSWSQGPKGTQSYAIICDDPDAPRAEPWVHLIVFNIPADVTELPEGSVKGQQGSNDYQQVGWGGPNPPSGTHRYYFKVYALSSKLDGLSSKTTKKDLLAAMKGKILSQGTVMGTFAA